MQIADSELESENYDAPKIVTTPPGPKSKALLDAQRRFETQAVVYSKYWPIAVESAKGSTIRDVDGNCYIDWVSGVSVLNLGHRNQEVTKAVRAQEDKIWHSLELPTETRINFLESLNEVLPGDLRNHSIVLFTVTGGDAAEASISLARWVTHRKTIISFEGAYHGISQGIVSMTSSGHYKEYAGVPDYGVFRLPYPYSYRPLVENKNPEEYAQFILDYLEHALKDQHSGLHSPAGIIVEPIQGEGGYIVPPRNFMPGLREIATRYAIPLIVDEIQCGLGRAGKMWASELTGTSPDILMISKTIGGGIPVSMIAYRSEYDRDLPAAFHLGTYRGSVLALAAGTAVLDLLRKYELPQRAMTVGGKIMNRLAEDAGRANNVGEVRGSGMMIGIELVDDLGTKAPATEFVNCTRLHLMQKGLLMHACGHFSNVFRFMGPLTISETLVDKGLDIFETTAIR